VFPREKGKDCAGPARLIGVVEVISAGIIEVDGFLDEPKPQGIGVEADVSARGASDRSYMVNAVRHGAVLLET
jgi:hypothetical protein